MKRILLIAGAALILLSGCSKKEAAAPAAAAPAPAAAPATTNLVFWSFTDELQGMINKYFIPSHPGITVEYSLTPTEQFPNKLDPVLASGQGAPDCFALEDAFVRKYIESGPDLLLDISDIYQANKDKLLAYPAEVGTFNGKVYGMSWQGTPGAMFYRRSLAKKYLGTDDPNTVQTYFANLDKFLSTAKMLKDKSKGACVVVSSTGDLLMPFKGARKQPWVVNGKLVIDPAMVQYMDLCKTLHDNRWEGRVGQWSEGWFAGMKGQLKDEAGKPVEVFCYFLPTWGLHYVLKTNAPDTSGDWAMAPGPAAYRWGGTWVAAWKNTKIPDVAKTLITYLTTDDTFLEQYAKDSGDFVSNISVVDKIKDTYSEPFLGGQNHYAVFAELAKKVDGKLTQGTDQAVEGLFNEAVSAYVNGEKTKDKALSEFQTQVQTQLGL